MEIHLKIIGVLLILLSMVHLVFPKQFNWKKDLAPITLINKQLMYVHTFFVAVVVFLIGLLSLLCADDLIHTPFGRKISLGLFVFWALRWIFQFFVYSPKLWRGKLFETLVHIFFSITWTYLCIIYLMIYLGKQF